MCLDLGGATEKGDEKEKRESKSYRRVRDAFLTLGFKSNGTQERPRAAGRLQRSP